MKNSINIKKTRIYSVVIIILIGIMFLLNVTMIITAENPDIEEVESPLQTNTPEDDQLYTVYIKNKEDQVINPTEDITIIPPNGTIVTLSSANSGSFKLTSENKTISISDVVTSLSTIQVKQSIDGLDDFNININFKQYLFLSSNDYEAYITKMKIDWGNGESITSDKVPITQSYTYKKQGTYPVNIQLTDRNGVIYSYHKNHTFKLTTSKFVELWVGENKESVAVSTAGISGAALIGFALTETGKYKLLALLPLLIPIYTRIQKEDVLDQFVRGQIFGFIKSNPGVHYNEIMRKLDMKNGTLSYHLHMLEKTRMIKSRKERYRYRAFYPTGMKFPKRERYRLTELQMAIIKIIKQNKGINQKEIAKKLDEQHQTINYNVKILQQAGIINLRRIGRKTSCFISEDDSDADN
jgi:DNA-binding MarR family transcriptional regulator